MRLYDRNRCGGGVALVILKPLKYQLIVNDIIYILCKTNGVEIITVKIRLNQNNSYFFHLQSTA